MFLPNPFPQKTTTKPLGPTPTAVVGQDAALWLAAHNARRANVSMGGPVPDLEWSLYLAQQANQWANKLASECGMYHPDLSVFQSGQNLYASVSGALPATPETVLKGWADSEKPYYNATLGDCVGGTCGVGRHPPIAFHRIC